MGNVYISENGLPSQRWRESFPSGEGLSRSAVDASPPSTTAVLWILDESGQRAHTLALLRRFGGRQPVAILSVQPQDARALEFFRLGARAYCHALAAAGLLRKVEAVLGRGGYWLGDTFMAALAGAVGGALANSRPQESVSLPEQLTPREQAVAREVAAGATNREVAERLAITERTVKSHLTAIFEKLGIRDRLQLAVLLNRRSRAADQAS